MRSLVFVAPLLLLAGCEAPSDARNFGSQFDGKIFRGHLLSGTAGVITDRETGCQYLVVGYTQPSATPRLNSAGEPMCSKAPGKQQNQP